jgi:hypothetical protein
MGTQVAVADQGQVDQAMEWLMRLPQLPQGELPAMREIEATVAALSEPVSPAWCMARVAALLSPYYDKDTPQAIRQMEAEDWLEALAGYPQWAIERAARWWRSEANEHRRKRPLEGDIAARCKLEMRGIGALPKLLRGRLRFVPHDPERSPRVDPKAAAEILARANLGGRFQSNRAE